MSYLKGLLIPSLLLQRVEKIIGINEVPHFLIMHSESEEWAARVAHAFLLDWMQSAQTVHPDLLTLLPQGKAFLHPMAKIDALLQDLSLAPYSGGKRGVLIRYMDRMALPSSNALLKALEEPSSSTVFSGTTQCVHKIIPTIRSRAQEMAIPMTEEYVIQRGKNDPVALVVEKFIQKMPLHLFIDLYSLSDELVAILEKAAKMREQNMVKTVSREEESPSFFLEEMISQAIHRILEVLLRTRGISQNQQKACLLAAEKALHAIEKNTSPREVFFLFLSHLH